jgi:hypothetical protein
MNLIQAETSEISTKGFRGFPEENPVKYRDATLRHATFPIFAFIFAFFPIRVKWIHVTYELTLILTSIF